MNKKTTFKATDAYDEHMPDNNFEEERWYIVTDGVYDFECWLMDNGIEFEEDEHCEGFYWVTKYGERTGEAYMIISEEDTDEDLCDIS